MDSSNLNNVFAQWVLYEELLQSGCHALAGRRRDQMGIEEASLIFQASTLTGSSLSDELDWPWSVTINYVESL